MLGNNEWVTDEDLELLSVDDPPHLPTYLPTHTLPHTPTHTHTHTTHPVVRYAKYPWDKWMNGDIYRAVPGKDFDVQPDVFRNMVNNTARRRGKFALTSKQSNGDVAFQVFNSVEEREQVRRGETP